MIKRIIHVDDDESMRNLVCRLLSPLEVEIEQAGNKSEFFHLPHLEADVYIFDRHFPDAPQNGPNDVSWRECLKFINEAYPRARVILLSGEVPEIEYKRGC